MYYKYQRLNVMVAKGYINYLRSAVNFLRFLWSNFIFENRLLQYFASTFNKFKNCIISYYFSYFWLITVFNCFKVTYSKLKEPLNSFKIESIYVWVMECQIITSSILRKHETINRFRDLMDFIKEITTVSL